jgi:hypothetical protein
LYGYTVHVKRFIEEGKTRTAGHADLPQAAKNLLAINWLVEKRRLSGNQPEAKAHRGTEAAQGTAG